MSRPKRARSTSPKRPPAPQWVWITAAIGVLVGIVAIAASASRTDQAVPTDRDPAAIAAGAELYAANCAVCHGVDLRGTGTGPPFLDVIYAPNHHADESFQRAVVGGVVAHHWNFGNMQPVAGLDRDDVAFIIEFVRSEQEANGILRDPRHP